MSNGVLTNKQPVNAPAHRASLGAHIKGKTIIQQATAASASSDHSLTRENTGQDSQRSLLNHNKRLAAEPACGQPNQPILIDLGRNHITRSQETGSGCPVLRNLNSVIVQPSTKGCGCQSQQPRRQDVYRAGAPNSDTSNRLTELSYNKYPAVAGAQYQQRSEAAARRHSAANRASLKRPHGQLEQSAAPVVGVDSGLPLALLTSSGSAGSENPQNQANQSDCNELDESEDEADFDYEKVLSNILNEKKLVSIQQTLSSLSLSLSLSIGANLDELYN